MTYRRLLPLLLLFFLPAVTAQAATDVIRQGPAGVPLSRADLQETVTHARYILIGHYPDNPGHQTRAAALIRHLEKSGRQPAVLLHHVERDRQNAFAIFRQRPADPASPRDATGLDILLDWAHSGQPDWTIVRPVFDVIMARQLPAQAVRLSRHTAGAIHQRGLAGLPRDLRDRLRSLLSKPLPAQAATRLARQVTADFCHPLPAGVIDKFTLLRRVQDGIFALAIAEQLARPEVKTIVLMAPANVLDPKSGLRRYLEDLGVEGPGLSLLFQEQDTPDAPPQDADIIWTTEGISRPAPCEAFENNS